MTPGPAGCALWPVHKWWKQRGLFRSASLRMVMAPASGRRTGDLHSTKPVFSLLADRYAAELRSADGGRSGGEGEVAVMIDGKDRDMRRAVRRVDDGEPVLIGRHSDVGGSAWQGDGLIECATLVVAEENGNGVAG